MIVNRDFPDGPLVSVSHLSLQGVWAPFLVGELYPVMDCAVKKKKNVYLVYLNKSNCITERRRKKGRSGKRRWGGRGTSHQKVNINFIFFSSA